MFDRIRSHASPCVNRLGMAVCVFGLVFGAFTATVFAKDGSTGRHPVSGKVKDSLGQPVAEVRVTIENGSGALIEKGLTSVNGRFSFSNIAPGVYELLAERAGFRKAALVLVVPKSSNADVLVTMEAEQPLTMSVRVARLRSQNDLSRTGASKYTMTNRDITNLPAGKYTPLNEVLLQMPGVALDQNQEIHIRGEHMGIQYQMNGVLLPLDINSDPTFTQLLNSFFVRNVSLLDGILPARYSYRTAGVIDIVTKSGCEQPGGDFSILGGQRSTAEPSFEMSGCKGNFGYYLTGLYLHNNMAFSSATPGPDPIHDVLNQGQGFGNFTYQLGPAARLSLMSGFTVFDGQFPNRPGLPAFYQLDNINPAAYPSSVINSSLEQQDYFGVLALNSAPAADLDYQLAYSVHYDSEHFNPDPVGDLIYQGLASRVFNSDLSNTLQGDLSWQPLLAHALRFGFYIGEYGVEVDDQSLVFPVNSQGQQLQTRPISVGANFNRINMLGGLYAEDTWHITDKLGVNFGTRWDIVNGFTNGNQVSPTINFFYHWRPATTLHAGFARYFQVPNFQAIAPDLIAVLNGTSGAVGAGPNVGNPFPAPERDYYWDAGWVHLLYASLKFEQDNYFRLDRNYLDEGEFGFVPIEAPFNYSRGYGWGTENSLTYNGEHLSARLNFTVAREEDIGVFTGQFNFPLAELAYIDNNHFILDHTAQYTISGGAAYRWRDWLFSVDGQFNTGLRAGFANNESLPNVCQINLSTAREVNIPRIGKFTDRVTLLNIFDRTNLIRPPSGIGVFQSAYGPRITVYNTLTIPLPGF
jgi:outer membrane receptor protein involved in Fe transport